MCVPVLVCVLAGDTQCKPKHYRNGPKLQLVKLTKQFSDVLTNSGNLFSIDVTQRLLNTVYPFTLPSAHAPLSYLVLSPPLSFSAHSVLLCSSFSIFSFPLAFPPPHLSFPQSFWLNKLVSLMSNDTSRSQSQLPDNKMAETFCLSTICVCLFQLCLPWPWCKEL